MQLEAGVTFKGYPLVTSASQAPPLKGPTAFKIAAQLGNRYLIYEPVRDIPDSVIRANTIKSSHPGT